MSSSRILLDQVNLNPRFRSSKSRSPIKKTLKKLISLYEKQIELMKNQRMPSKLKISKNHSIEKNIARSVPQRSPRSQSSKKKLSNSLIHLTVKQSVSGLDPKPRCKRNSSIMNLHKSANVPKVELEKSNQSAKKIRRSFVDYKEKILKNTQDTFFVTFSDKTVEAENRICNSLIEREKYFNDQISQLTIVHQNQQSYLECQFEYLKQENLRLRSLLLSRSNDKSFQSLCSECKAVLTKKNKT